MNQVLITGATGFIGHGLVALLQERGYRVSTLTRNPEKTATRLGNGMRHLAWSDRSGYAAAVAEVDVVFHLAGAGVAERRWSLDYKREIRDSRVETTRAIAAAKPRVLISASAIGYYGGHGDAILTEDSPPGDDFLADVCLRWEEAAQGSPETGRVALVRIGQVLGKGGGTLEAMLHPPAVPFSPWKFGVGGPLGDGKQWMSWVHLTDVLRLFLWCAENPEAQGPYNAVAPHPVTNAEFSHVLGKVLHRPSAISVPAFAIRALLGEFADYVLYSQRVVPKRASEQGFTFDFESLDIALQDILK